MLLMYYNNAFCPVGSIGLGLPIQLEFLQSGSESLDHV